jgi:hypothetical protein
MRHIFGVHRLHDIYEIFEFVVADDFEFVSVTPHCRIRNRADAHSDLTIRRQVIKGRPIEMQMPIKLRSFKERCGWISTFPQELQPALDFRSVLELPLESFSKFFESCSAFSSR